MTTLFGLIILVNTLAAFITVFKDTERDVSSTWAWLIVLMFPVVGFIIYTFFGKKISKDNIFDLKNQERLGLKYSTDAQKKQLEQGQFSSILDERESELVSLFLNTEDSLLMLGNEVEIIDDGHDKFNRLIEDIRGAKSHIFMQYYIFKSDDLGKRVMKALTEKAQEGVEVLVLYDAFGSRTIRPNFFNALKKVGGKAVPFFGSSIPFVNLRLNYRNHRKIAIIDGKIGYVGGFNIGDEYLGLGKLGYWRDTHLRITGEAVQSLQTRFFVDWNAVVKKKDQKGYKETYFQPMAPQGKVAMQIVSSGPESDLDQIKMGFLKMISMAQHTIYIQTPYFIPDESVMDALKIAIQSGIRVNIMIPSKPDHLFVYRATEYFAKRIQSFGAHVYVYDNGFLHAKILSIDGQIASVGTANFDIRSFKLNFEVAAFVYNAKFAIQIEQAFKRDIAVSIKADAQYFAQQSRWKKIKQCIARLFSPIL